MTQREKLYLLGRRIARLRRRNGFSQEELAAASGKMINTISNIERGLADPKYTTLTAIADTLHVPITCLCDERLTETKPYVDTADVIYALLKNKNEKFLHVALKQIQALSELDE